MHYQQNKVIGIVGGMGPQAGATLFNSIVCQTNASIDQQHLSVILMSFPQYIADRTAFLEGEECINPAFTIVKVIRKLEAAGAEVIGIACNTSHAGEIYSVIMEELDRVDSRVSLVHMPLATCSYIKDNYPGVRRIGLMTTNGTWRSGVYRDLLYNLGYEVVEPDARFQDDVIHKMVYDPVFGIKSHPAGVTTEVALLAEEALNFFENRQADAIILGCTELSVAITQRAVKGMLIVDSTEALARALIFEATGHKKSAKPATAHSGK